MKALTLKQINALATVLDMAEETLSRDKEENSIARSMSFPYDAYNLPAEKEAIAIVSRLWKRARKERGIEDEKREE